MKNSKRHNLKILIYLFILIIVIFFVAFFFYFPDLFLIYNDNGIYYSSSTRIIQIDKEVLKNLENLKKCGDWPLSQISPNFDRGNPFSSKKTFNEVMSAVSEVQCLNVIKN